MLTALRDERPAIASLADRLQHLPVLVAVSRDVDADGALSVAAAIERRYGAIVHVISIATTPDEVVHYARERQAALILTGLGAGSVEGASAREQTIIVAGRAHVPVLAVASDMRGLPRRAVAGIDFAPPSIRAARVAVDLIARPVSRAAALLRLLYVDDRPMRERSARAGATVVTELGVQAAFEQLLAGLQTPGYVRVDAVVRYGAITRELLRLATDSEADLIVVGVRHRVSVPEPAATGIIAEVLRGAHCSVLAVPPPY